MAKILIVDDEEMDRLLEGTLLEKEGHTVFFAQHGESALKVYDAQAIDLVITDLKMPLLNGLRLIRELKEADPGAVIVAVSGASADQLDLAKQLGAFSALLKPIDQQTLLDAVTEGLSQRKKGGSDAWGSRD